MVLKNIWFDDKLYADLQGVCEGEGCENISQLIARVMRRWFDDRATEQPKSIKPVVLKVK